jgi:tRNA(fMet)-specific endonuclease VapC
MAQGRKPSESLMYVLDTDHIVELHLGTRLGEMVRQRIAECDDEVVTTIISAEETMRGWLAEIHRARNSLRQISAYRRLGELFDDFAAMSVLPFDEKAARVLDELRLAKLRVGVLDLRIAAITLANGAKLASSNGRDFEQVPGLIVEDWLGR